MLITPNPITKNSVIQWHTEKKSSTILIEITNLYSVTEIVYDSVVNKGDHIFKLDNDSMLKASGIYFCRVTIDGHDQVAKIVKH